MNTRTRYLVNLAVAMVAVAGVVACGPQVNDVHFQFNNDFAGLLVVRAKSNEPRSFSGRIVVPKEGEIEVSQDGFSGGFRVSAERENGTRLPVGLLRNAAPADAFGLWQLPDGAFVRYFYLGRRDEMERFYQSEKDRLYRVEESRLERGPNRADLKP